MARWWWIATLALTVGTAACGGGGTSTPDAEDDAGDAGDVGDVEEVEDTTDVPTDGADADAGDVEVGDAPDGGDAADGADTGPETKRTAITLTAGGGRASSPNYRLTLSVGTPQPMGSAAAGTRRVEVGPGAVQNQ